MGFMPFSLTKGTIGLRLDYLAQFQSIRDRVRARLENYLASGDPKDHPIEVLKSIGSTNSDIEVEIDVLNDTKADFVRKINYLYEKEWPLDPSWVHVGDGPKYLYHDSNLHPHNQDSTGNRVGFLAWWTSGKSKGSGVFRELAEAIVEGIKKNTPRLEFWWDCSLEHGTGPSAEVIKQDMVTRVFFRTDHSAVGEDPGLGKRPPVDADPEDPNDVWSPGSKA